MHECLAGPQAFMLHCMTLRCFAHGRRGAPVAGRQGRLCEHAGCGSGHAGRWPARPENTAAADPAISGAGSGWQAASEPRHCISVAGAHEPVLWRISCCLPFASESTLMHTYYSVGLCAHRTFLISCQTWALRRCRDRSRSSPMT